MRCIYFYLFNRFHILYYKLCRILHLMLFQRNSFQRSNICLLYLIKGSCRKLNSYYQQFHKFRILNHNFRIFLNYFTKHKTDFINNKKCLLSSKLVIYHMINNFNSNFHKLNKLSRIIRRIFIMKSFNLHILKMDNNSCLLKHIIINKIHNFNLMIHRLSILNRIQNIPLREVYLQ